MDAHPEKFRPRFHFTPPAQWMNDPNGLVWHQGRYHLFYQYHPGSLVWGPMHWGHAASKDLLTWDHFPVALHPDSRGWIFSGSAVIDQEDSAGLGPDAMVAVFTRHQDGAEAESLNETETQDLAWSPDGGQTWSMYPHNPVLGNPGIRDFRDPKVFKNSGSGEWNMVLAAGDCLKFYASTDLLHWQFRSDYVPEVPEFEGVWECPDLFPLESAEGSRWVLLVSQTGGAPNGGSGTRYFIGEFDGSQFGGICGGGWLDHGMDFYAGVTWNDAPGGDRIVIAWMNNWQYAREIPASTWRGSMTLPRRLRLDRTGETWFLAQEPVLDGADLSCILVDVQKPDLPLHVHGTSLAQTVIDLELQAGVVQFSLELANDLGESFRMEYLDGLVLLDRRKSGQAGFSGHFAPGFQKLQALSPIRQVRLILDSASMEVFLDRGRYSMTNQVFPFRPFNSLRLHADHQGSASRLCIRKIGVPGY